MKKIIIPIGILFMTGFAYGQTNTENYVQTRTYLEPVTTSSSGAKQINTVQYFDGLGRPKQIVNVKASPSGKDVVTHIEYDAFGRQVKDYLPVPQSSTQNGAFIANPLGNVSSVYGSEKIFSEKVLENSPLDRIFEQKQVGNDWTGKPVKFSYDAVTVADRVRKFTTATTRENGATKSVLGEYWLYGDNQLYKNTVKDEDGNETVEFKNGRGQTILARKVVGADEYADTYYVYNEYDQLAFVVPPIASMRGDIVANTAKQDELCYQYRYDGKNRLVEKKLPGKGWEQMIYNKSGNMVYYRDTNLKSGISGFVADEAWVFTKYDRFGRIAYTGICRDGTDRQLIQQTVDNTGGAGYETRGESFTLNGVTLEYGNTAYPTYLDKILTVNYYDTYPSLPSGVSVPSTVLGQEVLKQADQSGSVKNTKGLPLASYIRNIEDDSWTKNYTYYDTRGRVIGTRSVNHLGGYTVTESELDFAGVPLQTKTYHKRLNTDTERTIAETFTYDDQNRLLVHKHKVDNNAEEILAQNGYDELSRLKTKKVGGTNAASPLQTVDYAYNIRGWMTGINDPDNLGSDLFGYRIKYNVVEGLETPNTDYMNLKVKPKYNGNIAEVDWRTNTAPGDNLRRYGYVYDSLNRLLAGFYQKDTNPSGREYFEMLEYDYNGNILSLKRSEGILQPGNTAMVTDDLNYAYTGNRLDSVTDVSGQSAGYPGGGGQIGYDNNGNMTSHPDKGIGSIRYNYLNLPDDITTGTGRGRSQTAYLYRADGTKLRKTGSTATAFDSFTDYLDGFRYTGTSSLLGGNNVILNFVPTSEGYYDFEKSKYIYNYADHLGNVRLGYTKSSSGTGTEVVEENNYYPFGMKHEGYNALNGNPAYNYKYNGKELQESGMYDYGARMYMPDVARWGVVDPLAETSRRWSTYTYAFNNPLRFIDPDGRQNEEANRNFSNIDDDISKEIRRDARNNSSPAFQFPKGQEAYYKKNYPAFYDLVKNQLPNMTKDTHFMNALSMASGFSIDELKEIFTYGKGMYLKIMDLPFGDAEYLHGGLTEGSTLNTSAIHTALADWFEKANRDTNSIEGLSNILYVTANIAHETSHWGDDLGKRKSNYEDIANFMLKNQGFRPTDVGNFFEYNAFGRGSQGIGIGHYNTEISDTVTNYVKANFKLLQSIFKTK